MLILLLHNSDDGRLGLGQFAPGQGCGLDTVPAEGGVCLKVIVGIHDDLFLHFEGIFGVETEAESVDHLSSRVRNVFGLFLIIDRLVSRRFFTLA